MRKISRQVEATAYHEAGHAVIAWRNRRPFTYVTIIPDGDSEGSCSTRPLGGKSFQPDIYLTLRQKERMEAQIKVFLAGGLAEAKFLGRKRLPAGAEIDLYNAIGLADYVTRGRGRVLEEAYLSYLREWTRADLEQDFVWRAVEALAASLIELQRIRRRDALATIRAAALLGVNPNPPYQTLSGREA